jgi:hypothetical protein
VLSLLGLCGFITLIFLYFRFHVTQLVDSNFTRFSLYLVAISCIHAQVVAAIGKNSYRVKHAE